MSGARNMLLGEVRLHLIPPLHTKCTICRSIGRLLTRWASKRRINLCTSRPVHTGALVQVPRYDQKHSSFLAVLDWSVDHRISFHPTCSGANLAIPCRPVQLHWQTSCSVKSPHYGSEAGLCLRHRSGSG